MYVSFIYQSQTNKVNVFTSLYQETTISGASHVELVECTSVYLLPHRLKLVFGIWRIFLMAGGHLVAGSVRSYFGRTQLVWRINPILISGAHNVWHDFWHYRAQEVHSVRVARLCPCVSPLWGNKFHTKQFRILVASMCQVLYSSWLVQRWSPRAEPEQEKRGRE